MLESTSPCVAAKDAPGSRVSPARNYAEGEEPVWATGFPAHESLQAGAKGRARPARSSWWGRRRAKQA